MIRCRLPFAFGAYYLNKSEGYDRRRAGTCFSDRGSIPLTSTHFKKNPHVNEGFFILKLYSKAPPFQGGVEPKVRRGEEGDLLPKGRHHRIFWCLVAKDVISDKFYCTRRLVSTQDGKVCAIGKIACRKLFNVTTI